MTGHWGHGQRQPWCLLRPENGDYAAEHQASANGEGIPCPVDRPVAANHEAGCLVGRNWLSFRSHLKRSAGFPDERVYPQFRVDRWIKTQRAIDADGLQRRCVNAIDRDNNPRRDEHARRIPRYDTIDPSGWIRPRPRINRGMCYVSVRHKRSECQMLMQQQEVVRVRQQRINCFIRRVIPQVVNRCDVVSREEKPIDPGAPPHQTIDRIVV